MTTTTSRTRRTQASSPSSAPSAGRSPSGSGRRSGRRTTPPTSRRSRSRASTGSSSPSGARGRSRSSRSTSSSRAGACRRRSCSARSRLDPIVVEELGAGWSAVVTGRTRPPTRVTRHTAIRGPGRQALSSSAPVPRRACSPPTTGTPLGRCCRRSRRQRRPVGRTEEVPHGVHRAWQEGLQVPRGLLRIDANRQAIGDNYLIQLIGLAREVQDTPDDSQDDDSRSRGSSRRRHRRRRAISPRA